MSPCILLDITSGVLPILLPASSRAYHFYFIFSQFFGRIVVFRYMNSLGQTLRAGFSSNGSFGSQFGTFSIEFSARLSTRTLRFSPPGTTTAFGPYANSFLEVNHYAFGGRQCHKGISLFGTPLRLRGRLGVFRRREGHLLAALLGPSLRHRLVLRFSSFTRRFVIPRFAACGPSSGVVHSPFFFGYVFFFCGPLFAVSTSSGADGRASRLRSSSPMAIVFSIPLILVYVFRGVSAYRGGRTGFPTAVEYVAEFTFFVFLPFPCSRVCGSHVIAL